jgi:hypothetical protein
VSALVAGFGRTMEPARRFHMVRRQNSAGRIETTYEGRRFRIAGRCRPTQPGFAFGTICLHAVAMHERQPPTQLAAAVTHLRSAAIKFRRRCLVARRAQTVLADHAEQIERSGKFRFGGFSQIRDHFAPHLLAATFASQG